MQHLNTLKLALILASTFFNFKKVMRLQDLEAYANWPDFGSAMDALSADLDHDGTGGRRIDMRHEVGNLITTTDILLSDHEHSSALLVSIISDHTDTLRLKEFSLMRELPVTSDELYTLKCVQVDTNRLNFEINQRFTFLEGSNRVGAGLHGLLESNLLDDKARAMCSFLIATLNTL